MTIEKQKVDDLTAIPADAELILNAPWARTKSDTGFPSNELYVMTSTGEHITQITHHRKLYDHIAVSPDRKKIAVARFAGDSDGDGKITWQDRKTIGSWTWKTRRNGPSLPNMTPDGAASIGPRTASTFTFPGSRISNSISTASTSTAPACSM